MILKTCNRTYIGFQMSLFSDENLHRVRYLHEYNLSTIKLT